LMLQSIDWKNDYRFLPKVIFEACDVIAL